MLHSEVWSLYFADPRHSFGDEHEFNGRAVRATIAANSMRYLRAVGTSE
ncbi:MAG: hypothetical protein ABI862_19965 [Ilumatobacteraceae bacterium]